MMLMGLREGYLPDFHGKSGEQKVSQMYHALILHQVGLFTQTTLWPFPLHTEAYEVREETFLSDKLSRFSLCLASRALRTINNLQST